MAEHPSEGAAIFKSVGILHIGAKMSNIYTNIYLEDFLRVCTLLVF